MNLFILVLFSCSIVHVSFNRNSQCVRRSSQVVHLWLLCGQGGWDAPPQCKSGWFLWTWVPTLRYVIWATIVARRCLWHALHIAWRSHALALKPYNTLQGKIYLTGGTEAIQSSFLKKKGGLLQCWRQQNRICAQVLSARNIFMCCTFTAIVQCAVHTYVLVDTDIYIICTCFLLTSQFLRSPSQSMPNGDQINISVACSTGFSQMCQWQPAANSDGLCR